VKALVNLAPQRLKPEVIAQEYGLQRFGQFTQRLLGRVLHVILREAPQDGFGVRRSQP
jgi:hypothetical protein